MSKENKQGLIRATTIVGGVWVALYLILAFTYLKLDLSAMEVVQHPEARAGFMVVSVVAFVIAWLAQAHELRTTASTLHWVQNGGKLTKETLEVLERDNTGMNAYVERSGNGQRWAIQFHQVD